MCYLRTCYAHRKSCVVTARVGPLQKAVEAPAQDVVDLVRGRFGDHVACGDTANQDPADGAVGTALQGVPAKHQESAAVLANGPFVPVQSKWYVCSVGVADFLECRVGAEPRFILAAKPELSHSVKTLGHKNSWRVLV